MKSDAEMTAAILQETHVRAARRRKSRTALLAAAALTLAVTAAGLGLRHSARVSNARIEAAGVPGGQVQLQPGDADGESAAVTAETSAAAPENTAVPTQAPHEDADAAAIAEKASAIAAEPATHEPVLAYGGDTAGGAAWVNIPALPADRTIVETGEPITDAEAQAYFAAHRASLASSLAASGVETAGLTVAPRGYCHVSYDGSEGGRLELRRNFRDYLVYSGDRLIAIVTLTKENGEITATPAFGAPWFDAYARLLAQHRGEALVYVYAGYAELILTPDDAVLSPMGTEGAARYLEGVEHPYQLFYAPAAAYTP